MNETATERIFPRNSFFSLFLVGKRRWEAKLIMISMTIKINEFEQKQRRAFKNNTVANKVKRVKEC